MAANSLTTRPSLNSSVTHRGITVVAKGFPRGTQAAAVRAARHALTSEGIVAGRLELASVDDGDMRRLHREWMGKDCTTDVLTFDLREPDRRGKKHGDERRGTVDGQVIVCVAEARRRSAALGVTLKDELSLYVVHGCLHLCGYDDHRPTDAARMHKREDQLLIALGQGPIFSAGPAGRSGSEKGLGRRRRHR